MQIVMLQRDKKYEEVEEDFIEVDELEKSNKLSSCMMQYIFMDHNANSMIQGNIEKDNNQIETAKNSATHDIGFKQIKENNRNWHVRIKDSCMES